MLGGKVAVLLGDLDDFKLINDSLGHEAGDRLIVEIDQRLRGCPRPADTAAYLGGAEFAVLLEDVATGEEGCVGCATRLGSYTRTRQPG